MADQQRLYVRSGAEWEDKVGYSRAIRVGDHIEVAGTVSVENGELIGPNDPYAQTIQIIKIIRAAIEETGGQLSDVVRTRIYVTDISQWPEIGRAHGHYFKDIKPATSMVQISQLIEADYLVEMEATAIVR